MSKSGSLLEQARTAILNAYNRDELRLQVRSGLGERLENIVPDSDFTSQVDSLLEWADRHRRQQELLDQLASGRPDDPDLRDIAAALRARTPVSDVPPSLLDESSTASQSTPKQAEAPDNPTEKSRQRTGLVGKVVVGLLLLFIALVTLRLFGDDLSGLVGTQRRAQTLDPTLAAAASPEQLTSALTSMQSIATPVVTALPVPVDTTASNGGPPSAALATPKTATQLFESGRDLSTAKNWTEAIDTFGQAIQAGYAPAWVAHFEIGNAYFELAAATVNDPARRRALYTSALDAYDKVLESKTGRTDDSLDGKLCRKRGLALAELGQNEEAVAAFDCATSHNEPLTSRDYWINGMVLMKLGRYDDAIRAFSESAATAESARSRAEAYLQMAQAESKKPDKSSTKVVEYLNLAIEADSTYPDPYASLGMEYEGSGDREAACSAYLNYAERVDVLTDPVKTHLKQLQCTR